MQKLLKTQYFMNEMYEYEIKSFSKKTLEFNPDLPKTRFFFNQFVSKTQILKTFCIKIKEL